MRKLELLGLCLGLCIAVPSLVKYVFNIEGIELQKLGVPQQPGKRYIDLRRSRTVKKGCS